MTNTKRNILKFLGALALLGSGPLLSGCATQIRPPVAAAAVQPDWLPEQQLQIELDGRSYRGSWHSQACHTDACRGVFRNVKRYERRQITRAEAQLASADGLQLDCTWTRFRTQLEGMCQTPDGQQTPLRLID